MNSITPLAYSPATYARADQALRCAPFDLTLFKAMEEASIPLAAIATVPGYTRQPLGEDRIEAHLAWLIQVGLLRREVDGQGITDSFRLTPLGKQLVWHWQQMGSLPRATCGEQWQNQLRRWRALSF